MIWFMKEIIIHLQGLSGCDSLLVLLLWLNRMLNPSDSPGLLKIWEKVSKLYHGTATRASLDQAFLRWFRNSVFDNPFWRHSPSPVDTLLRTLMSSLRLYLSLPSWILLQTVGDQDTQMQELCAAINDSWVGSSYSTKN